MKRLVALVLTVLVTTAAILVTACGPKDDKPPLTPDDPTVSEPADAGTG